MELILFCIKLVSLPEFIIYTPHNNMKHLHRISRVLRNVIISCLIFIPLHHIHSQETPFSRGVNITNWFQVDSAKQVQFTKYTKQDFINIQSLGFDVIRLPMCGRCVALDTPHPHLHPVEWKACGKLAEGISRRRRRH